MGIYDRIDFNSKDVWQRYYKKKETAKQIAEVYGCSNVSVLNFIRSQGWEVFGQREAQIPSAILFAIVVKQTFYLIEQLIGRFY